MSENVRYVGLDVHKDTITMAVAEEGRGDARVVATIPNSIVPLLKQLRRLGLGEFAVLLRSRTDWVWPMPQSPGRRDRL